MTGILPGLARKLLQYVALLLLVTFATFLLSSLIPGDYFATSELDPSVSRSAIDELRRRHALDQPVVVQYARWLSGLARLDLGTSLFYGTPVLGIVAGALSNTLWIGLPALALGIGGGILLGTVRATRRGRPSGKLLDLLSTIGLSLPSLVLGLIALLIAARTHWFPLGGMDAAAPATSAAAWLAGRIRHVLLPAACLTIPVLAAVERVHCAAMQTGLEEPFIRAARARGITGARLAVRYMLRPALNPVLSTSGPILAAVLSGSVVLEVIFAWPGLGQVTYNALFTRDVFLLLGCVTASSVLLIAGNAAADFLLMALDPRARGARRGGRL